ncbi:uncharacterized protein [Rutidosis leptorrhynchoides]|uniref:uncharacterized protein n=1 Tax=Rutidosis leptorrhynchoides TaxID=125765 RepID=UPI003A9A2E51
MPPPQPRGSFAGRLSRALDNSLSLLHRSKSKFFILGATGNVYTVTLSTTPYCTCPDPMTPCKHILFVYLRVLSLSTDYALLRRRTLSPSMLFGLLHSATSPDSFASERLRKRFLELHKIDDDGDADNGDNDNNDDDDDGRGGFEDGSTCPVCLDEMRKNDGRKVVVCATCKNPIHESCLMAWKDESSRTCVMCRARWGKIGEQEQEQREYINLSAYIDEGGNMGNVDHGQEA